MVHVRLNEKQANPNPLVNFTTALPAQSADDEHAARELLRALAAQVKPVMKKHGFSVNSLEEYEFNTVFAGRNWNNGEVVELVLRRPDGSFYPMSYLLNTLCHELAHIKHMNHSAPFQSLWASLRREVLALQSRGYYGDGLWSAGHRLGDSARVASSASLPLADLPEYTCGGAQARPRPRSTGQRRRRQLQRRGRAGVGEPSARTGRQTERRRKAGGRVAKEVFGEGGARLDGRAEAELAGSTRGKRAQAKGAREMRALAAERRVRALEAQAGAAGRGRGAELDGGGEQDSEDESGEEDDDGPESDDDTRRQTMSDQMQRAEIDQLRTGGSGSTPRSNSNSKPASSSTSKPGQARIVIDLTQEDDADLPDISDMLEDDFASLPGGGGAYVQPQRPAGGTSGKEKGKGRQDERTPSGVRIPNGASAGAPGKRPRPEPTLSPPPPTKKPRQGTLSSFVKDEMQQRKSEALGLGGAKRLGGLPGTSASATAGLHVRRAGQDQPKPSEPRPGSGRTDESPGIGNGNGNGDGQQSWACAVCTFVNAGIMDRCEMCETPKGRG